MIMKFEASEYRSLILSNDKANRLKRGNNAVIVVDSFNRQINELFFIDNHKYIGADKEVVYKTQDFKKYKTKKEKSFVWVYYPWNYHLVKTVRADDYFRLKTNRNQDLITAAEQKKLYNYKVAVFGMSVGSNIAFVATQAGIAREITIADFDNLDNTNLNRIFGGVHQIGLNKCVLAARRIYEDNPFAKVRIMPKGITEDNLEPLLAQKKLNCLVDEIDNLPMKINLRKLALKYKVPVIMVTDNGNGIVLHIERYDLGYKKIFHRPLSYWNRKLREFGDPKINKMQMVGSIIMKDIVGGIHLVDPEMIKSVKKVISKKLVSWPQLGSAAMLGGVYAVYALKKIALSKDKQLVARIHINPHL
ncbi:MAG: ThiF family adenylyltransferase [bacterium]|nr:ThiF family adenylyltransferase [bacterium]